MHCALYGREGQHHYTKPKIVFVTYSRIKRSPFRSKMSKAILELNLIDFSALISLLRFLTCIFFPTNLLLINIHLRQLFINSVATIVATLILCNYHYVHRFFFIKTKILATVHYNDWKLTSLTKKYFAFSMAIWFQSMRICKRICAKSK